MGDRALTSLAERRSFEQPLLVAVTHSSSEAVYRVVGADLADLFASLAAASVNVDALIQVDDEIVFSAARERRGDVGRALAWLGLCWTERVDLDRITVVGGGMKTRPGVVARIFAVIRSLDIEAEFVSTSPRKVSFYVPSEAAEATVRALHQRLFT